MHHDRASYEQTKDAVLCLFKMAERLTMSIFYRNWPVHNMIAHPLMEILYWACRPFGQAAAKRISQCVHDLTVPDIGGPYRDGSSNKTSLTS